MPVTNYIYDGNQYLAEADGTNTINRVFTNEPDTYTHLISQEDVSSGDSLNYHYDAIGSTREVTDDTETVTDEFTYDAWGNRLSRSGTSDIPFQYVGEQGYYRDDSFESYYVMERIYDPNRNRWLSVDPLSFVDGLNLFSYVGNMPSETIDPTGQLLCEPEKDYCGAEVGAQLVLTLQDVRRRLLAKNRIIRRIKGNAPWPWDIDFSSNGWGPTCPTDPCTDNRGKNLGFCVSVFGKKQRNFAVNYALLGCIESLVGGSLDVTLNLARTWKKVSGKGSEWDCEVERWISVGFAFCSRRGSISKLMDLPENWIIAPHPDAIVRGCPIKNDPQYDHCELCPDDPIVKKMDYDLYYYLEDDKPE